MNPKCAQFARRHLIVSSACPVCQEGAQDSLPNLPIHCPEEESGGADEGGIQQTAEGETQVHHCTFYQSYPLKIYNY